MKEIWRILWSTTKWYVRLLRNAFLVAVFVPPFLLIIGCALHVSALIALAGFILCISTGYLALSFSPIVIALSLPARLLDRSEHKELLITRFLESTLTILLVECLATLYLLVMPIANHLQLVPLLAIGLMMIIILSLHNRKSFGRVIRIVSKLTVAAIFFFSTLWIVFPSAMYGVEKNFGNIDNEIAYQIKQGLDFEGKRDKALQEKLEKARQDSVRVLEERQMRDEEEAKHRLEIKEISEDRDRQLRLIATEKKKAEQAARLARASELQAKESARKSELARQKAEQSESIAKILANRGKPLYKEWGKWKKYEVDAERGKPVKTAKLHSGDSVEVRASGTRIYEWHGYQFTASPEGCAPNEIADLPRHLQNELRASIPLESVQPFAVALYIDRGDDWIIFNSEINNYRFFVGDGLSGKLCLLNNIPPDAVDDCYCSAIVEVRVKEFNP